MVKEHPLTKCLHCHLSFRSSQLMKLHVIDEHPEAEGEMDGSESPNQRPVTENKVSKKRTTTTASSELSRLEDDPLSAKPINKKIVIRGHLDETGKRIMPAEGNSSNKQSSTKSSVRICTICNIGFVNDVHFQAHIAKCRQNKEICSVCNSAFDTRQEVNEHMSKEHPLTKCLYCRNSFRCPILRKSHMVNAHEEHFHFCTICWSPHETVEELEEHIAESHPPTSKRKVNAHEEDRGLVSENTKVSKKKKTSSSEPNDIMIKSEPVDLSEREEPILPGEENPSGSHVLYIKEERLEYDDFAENDQNPLEAFE